MYLSHSNSVSLHWPIAATMTAFATSCLLNSPNYFISRIGIIPNHAMAISEFIGRTITLLHRVDSRNPQHINRKTLPMRNAGLFDGVYSYIKHKNRESA